MANRAKDVNYRIVYRFVQKSKGRPAKGGRYFSLLCVRHCLLERVVFSERRLWLEGAFTANRENSDQSDSDY